MSTFETQILGPARMAKWDDIKRLMDVASGLDWATLTPTKDEILEYFSLIDKAGKAGVAPSVEASRALKSISTWIASGPKSCFPPADIDVHRSAFQLALRICWPELLNQGGCGFCGPTTMLYGFVQRYPEAYAQCGMDLIGKGTGTIKINCGILGLDIEIDPSTEAKDWKTSGVPEMDFLMMRGIRKRAELLVTAGSTGGANFDFNVENSFATTPKQVAHVLRKSGYKNVKDCTTHWPGQPGGGPPVPQRFVNLLGCSFLCKMPAPTPIIIMLIEGDFAAQYFRTGITPKSVHSSTELATLHWIVVENLDASNDVKGKMITWTRTRDFIFKKEDFLPYYYGYVTGTP